MAAKRFSFRGTVPASKSILNRLLVMRSYCDDLKIIGDSNADDVVKMKSALKQLKDGLPADCGDAGTTLRFLALRAARLPGRHTLMGSERLFSRPQNEIVKMLAQLGRPAELSSDRIEITGGEWRSPASGKVVVDRSQSSQFASALLLNAWGLNQDLTLQFEGERVSDSYFNMTHRLVAGVGMSAEWLSEDQLFIPARQEMNPKMIRTEIDLSSAFAVAALAVAHRGVAEIENWPRESLQPDTLFTKLLFDMGCAVRWMDGGTTLHVARTTAELRPLEVDLANAPDLFPILSVLCAIAPGTSRLFGAPHLKNKESDRVAKTIELIRLMGAQATEAKGGLKIEGVAKVQTKPCTFDPDQDHRLAMAAAVAIAAGADIKVFQADVVNKSFPEFWEIARGHA